MKKRIVFVITSLAVGGAEGQLLTLVRSLDRSKFEPVLVLLDGTGIERAGDLQCSIHVLGVLSGGYTKRLGSSLSAARGVARMAKIIKREQPDIVHAFLPAACILAAVAARLSRTSARVIVSRRSLADSYRSNDFFAGAVDRYCTKYLADLAIGNSRKVSQELASVDGVSASRVLTIYNGVEVRSPKLLDQASLNIPIGSTVFSMVGNFRWQKGHEDFVKVAAELTRILPNSFFLMLGQDQGTLSTTREAISRAKLQNCLMLDQPGLASAVYQASDIYLCTSQSEGFSNVILEAMAHELPVIASDVGGNAEAVVDGVTGFIVAPGNVPQFVEKAELLAKDSRLRRQMGESGRRRAEEHFSVDAMVGAYEGVYKRLGAAALSLSAFGAVMSALL